MINFWFKLDRNKLLYEIDKKLWVYINIIHFLYLNYIFLNKNKKLLKNVKFKIFWKWQFFYQKPLLLKFYRNCKLSLMHLMVIELFHLAFCILDFVTRKCTWKGSIFYFDPSQHLKISSKTILSLTSKTVY